MSTGSALRSTPTSSRTTIQDPIFLQGLESILAPLLTNGASEEEVDQLTKRAEAFYLSSLVPAAAAETSSSDTTSVVLESPSLPHSVPSSLPSSAAPSALPVPVTESSSSVPPYPLSFTALAALIATGAPIPGIREIEDRFADGMETVSLLVGTTRKPWEVVADSAELSSGNAAAEVEEKGIEAQ